MLVVVAEDVQEVEEVTSRSFIRIRLQELEQAASVDCGGVDQGQQQDWRLGSEDVSGQIWVTESET